ncbi:MAG: NAD(P)H-dependent oxidoreductase [Candidatus Bathyarchaeia archaeon]|jgi:multimeric flavodoxin WrbA
MNQPRKVLLLIGSPRGERSNSYAIGKFLVNKLEEKGLLPEEAFAARLVNTQKGAERLLRSVDNADIIVLATPLYVDSLPSPTIKALELIFEHRKAVFSTKSQMLVAIMNSGFPEKEQMDIALKIIQNFAQESNFKWGGGIRVGWGMALNSEPLKEKKGMTRKLTAGLSLASVNLSEGQPISKEAEELASTLFLPLFVAKSVSRLFGNRGWNKLAKDNNAQAKMCDRPCELNQ